MPVPEEITVESVKQWIHALPYANRKVTGQETMAMLEQLEQLERMALTAGDHNTILHDIFTPANLLLSHLEDHISAGHPQKAQFLKLGVNLCKRLVGEMDRVVTDEPANRHVAGQSRRATLSSIRAAEYIERECRLHLGTYQAPPKRVWTRAREITSSCPQGFANPSCAWSRCI